MESFKKNVIVLKKRSVVITLLGVASVFIFLAIFITGQSFFSKSPQVVLGVSADNTSDQHMEQPIREKALGLSPENILWYVNQERERYDIAPLKLNTELNGTAASKNKDMLHYDYFDHTNPVTHKTFDTFFDSYDYSFIKIGENLAMGNFTTSKDVVDAWMKSPNHRKNILDPGYRDMGIDISQGSINGSTTLVITQHFGIPKANCPLVDENKKTTIKNLQDKLTLNVQFIDEQRKIIGDYENQNLASGDGYTDAINRHNSLVMEHNDLISHIEQLATEYNNQVVVFEACIKEGGMR